MPENLGACQPSSTVAAPAGGQARPWIRPLLLGLAVLGLLAAAKLLGLGDRLGELRAWIVSLGALGPVVYIAVYAVAVVAAIPGSVLTIAAGAMFGSLIGVATVSIGSTLGAAAAFVVARWFARTSVTRWLGSNATFARLERMTEQHGAIIVAITRLVPIFPFNLLNYGFGLTRVPFRTYVLWSWLCMLPGTVLYVVGADAVSKGLAEGRVPWLLVVVIATVAAGLYFVVRRARRALSSAEQRT